MRACVQEIKARLGARQPKTVNNVLATLSKMLRVAKRLRVITAVPVETFELLKVRSKPPVFYDFEEYGRLVAAAGALDDRILAMVLLAGDAGLRPGEIVDSAYFTSSRRRPRPARRLALAFSTRARKRGSFSSR